MHRFIPLILIFAFIITACENKESEKPKIVKISQKVPDPVKALQNKIASAISKIKPSVVTILSKSGGGKTPIIFRFSDEIPPVENESLGSGFVLKKDNKYLYIVTNSHVIEKAKFITIRFSNNYKTEAKIVGKDAKSDIALLKVEISKEVSHINPVKIGDPKKLKLGYFVISGGSPYNLGLSFTIGIISALNRNLGISAYENYIQTDAAINPGDSGGPLFNIDGEVVGMNTAIIQTGQGLSFALPISTVVEIADQLLKYGKVRRGWLGILVQDLPESVRKKYRLKYGVQVIKVFKNSPAYTAGIKSGDIVLSIKGKKISSPSELKYIVSQLKPEENVIVELIRKGQKHKIEVKIKELVDKK
ncbi:serine protease, S1-C subfamily, contains C-terminal PDZ domain [Persephonella hydrogeniphila]|uniref:Serine protease, S1-C subfamily, contains C-terminal PDZ domain n=1 Tax=Persephonella hydrogeniphila TaxID=198703 RepID=A0A285NBA1_9AQUI|nr:trypsin-like peptidase domain-containing protein [Persephonella hydrogeniphila]SNZ06588.1 serine protease, S1-C subfamily, contains C-terminal PDZ domain [Persephonella hydrogeniphila]